MRLGAAYSWHDIETKRDVSVGTYNDRLEANYDARSAQVFGEVGYTMEAAGIALEPFAGLAYVNYDTDKAKEKGGVGRLKADADQDITFSTLGLRAGKVITLAVLPTCAGQGLAQALLKSVWDHAAARIHSRSFHEMDGSKLALR